MSVSFGIEFEFDYINSSDEIRVSSGSYPTFLSRNWDYQSDPTASSELRSPVFTSLQQFIDECNNQFGGMINDNMQYIPLMFNTSGRSLGQHMHIGKPNMRLSYNAKYKIAKAILPFYPFLAAIHAQPIPSIRGLTSMYTRSLARYGSVISDDHYAEISDSHVGTVELRIFDANIPQASLVNAWIVTSLAKKALRSRAENSDDNIDFNLYDDERSRALRYGLIGLNVTEYLKTLRNILGNIEIPDIPAIKELLYVMCKYRLNFFGVWRYVNASMYNYMKAQLSDCSKFLENLLRISNIRHEEKINRWISESCRYENLEQFIGLSIAVDESLQEYAITYDENTCDEITVIRTRLTRSHVREALEEGRFYLARLDGVEFASRNQVAQYISDLLRFHGDGMVNMMTSGEIIDTPFRFYVLVAYNRDRSNQQICGTISVHVREGEIRSLVVDRRYRRLGIGRILIQHVLNVLNQNGTRIAFAYIRRDNNASINLFRSLGFKVDFKGEECVRVSRSLEG